MCLEEESTPFLDKMNEVCEMQMTTQEYIPITVSENIIKSMEPDEVFIFDMVRV